MPEVVSQVEGSNPNVRSAKKNGGYRSWKVSPDLFPCDLPQQLQKQADDAVQVRALAQGCSRMIRAIQGCAHMQATSRVWALHRASPVRPSCVPVHLL